jgi:hypothetical protein
MFRTIAIPALLIENVDRAQRRGYMIDHLRDGCGLRYVGGDRDRAAADVLDFRDHRIGFSSAFPVVDRDRGTGFGECCGNRRSNAARRTRHQCDAAVQIRRDGHDRSPYPQRVVPLNAKTHSHRLIW